MKSRLEDLIGLLSHSKDLGLGDIVLDGVTREEVLSADLDLGLEFRGTATGGAVDQNSSNNSAVTDAVFDMNYEVLEETATHCQKCFFD